MGGEGALAIRDVSICILRDEKWTGTYKAIALEFLEVRADPVELIEEMDDVCNKDQ